MTRLEIDSLSTQVMDLGNDVKEALTRSARQSFQYDRKLERIKKQMAEQNHSEIQDELDTLALASTRNTQRIKSMEDGDYDTQIEGLNEKLSTVEGMLDEMEESHSNLINQIASSISAQSERIVGITEMFGGLKHKLISEEEYKLLGIPDDETLYFTYEE